jgi:hypothetical protein
MEDLPWETATVVEAGGEDRAIEVFHDNPNTFRQGGTRYARF